LSATSKTYPIYYSIDDIKPSKLYSNPIAVNSSMNIKAVIRDLGTKNLGSTFEQQINLHKGVGAKITIDKEPHTAYNSGGKQALINGISGNNKRYGDREWLGFFGEDVEVIIEFDKPTEINAITTRFYNGNGQWIYAPKELNLQLKLEDESAISSRTIIKSRDPLIVNFNLDISPFYPKDKVLKRKMLKITIPNYGIIPEGKQGAGHKAWTFIDEIIVE
jgi:hexosaminidase